MLKILLSFPFCLLSECMLKIVFPEILVYTLKLVFIGGSHDCNMVGGFGGGS